MSRTVPSLEHQPLSAESIGSRLGEIAAREAMLQQTSAEHEEAAHLNEAAAKLSPKDRQRVIDMATNAQFLAMKTLGLMSESGKTG